MNDSQDGKVVNRLLTLGECWYTSDSITLLCESVAVTFICYAIARHTNQSANTNKSLNC